MLRVASCGLNKNSKKGFTLLELLVVIGIISILVTMGFASYSTAQKKARDARRKTDLKAVQNSLEQYYSVCGYQYPTPPNTGFFKSINCTSPVATIMPNVPTDPLVTPYSCNGCTGTTYEICSSLESEPTPSADGYCLTNEQ